MTPSRIAVVMWRLNLAARLCALVFVLIGFAACGQPAQSPDGVWRGFVKTKSGEEVAFTLEVKREGDKIAGIFEEDTHGEYPPGTVEGDVTYGNVFYTKKGGIETAKNTGKQRYREILVELKD